MWLGFIDIDEFLVLRDPKSSSNGTAQQQPLASPPDLIRFLKPYEKHGGLVVNWRMFGSSGHVQRPQQPVTQAYTRALPISAEEHRWVAAACDSLPLLPRHFAGCSAKRLAAALLLHCDCAPAHARP